MLRFLKHSRNRLLKFHDRQPSFTTNELEIFGRLQIQLFTDGYLQLFSQSLWIAICCRLCLSVDVKFPIQRYHVVSLHFEPQSCNPLSGIIAYLTSQHDGNVSDRGIVNVSGSTICSSNVAKNAVDLLPTCYFNSMNEPNQWLCYDFRDRKVRPKHYSIHGSIKCARKIKLLIVILLIVRNFAIEEAHM
jgi:hypothetical protein